MSMLRARGRRLQAKALSQLLPRRFGEKRQNPKAKVGIGWNHITVCLAVGSSDSYPSLQARPLPADMTV
jgi:hypothetical protein